MLAVFFTVLAIGTLVIGVVYALSVARPKPTPSTRIDVRNGYLVIEGELSDEEIEALQAALDAVDVPWVLTIPPIKKRTNSTGPR